MMGCWRTPSHGHKEREERAARYTAAWCGQDASGGVAAHFANDRSADDRCRTAIRWTRGDRRRRARFMTASRLREPTIDGGDARGRGFHDF